MLRVGEIDQQVVEATVVRQDPATNVAVLKAEPSAALVALRPQAEDELFTTMPVTAFGYPMRGRNNMTVGELPSLSVNPGHVTSLQKRGGELQRILLDAQVDRGQIGGPLLDDAGHVIAIIDGEGRGGQMGSAMPLSRLHGGECRSRFRDSAGPAFLR